MERIRGEGEERNIHTKVIEIYVATRPSVKKIGAMKLPWYNKIAHTIF